MASLSDKSKKAIIQDVNCKIGDDIYNMRNAEDFENELVLQRQHLQSCLHACNDAAPTKLSSAIQIAESNSMYIKSLKEKSVVLKEKVDDFTNKNSIFIEELDKRFTLLTKLEEALAYLKSYSKFEDLCTQMKQCKDDEQLVALYGELKNICNKYKFGHRGAYIKDYTHYWHDILKENISKHYEDHLKVLKWPLASGAENSPLPKEVINKFTNITRYLFLIQEPEDLINTTISADVTQDQYPCLPIRILLRPLKKRFAFHFTGSRQTARIDRPEWFLTQILTWIKDHQTFVRSHVQPVADKLSMNNVDAVNEFNTALLALAAERLHTVLAAYHTQGAKGDMLDVDAHFAHAVDETLGFHRELVAITGTEASNILSVLTKADTFVQWLAVERKYALAKMDEILDNGQWYEPVAAGVSAAVGSMVWVPRGADWFITVLKTIEDRYTMLPQPGHRLQFLELQLELIEEWRVRLTQLVRSNADAMRHDTLMAPGPYPLTSVVNAAHHTHSVLVLWATSLNYLQLHYYRRQFLNFTKQQHRAGDESPSNMSNDTMQEEKEEVEIGETMSLSEVEIRAKKLALSEVSRRTSTFVDKTQSDVSTVEKIAEKIMTDDTYADEEDGDEKGAFGDACDLLAVLTEGGLQLVVQHIMLEFKATIRDYKNRKWHAMAPQEEAALCVSAPLCGPLAALCARLAAAANALAPRLAARLRSQLAEQLDNHLLEDVVLGSWFNSGGIMQLTYDVNRILVPAFAPPNKTAQKLTLLPKLQQACGLLNLEHAEAELLRVTLARGAAPADSITDALGVFAAPWIPPTQALLILNHRTDLADTAGSTYVMNLF